MNRPADQTDGSRPTRFAVGDRVRHAGKPEWGEGGVTAAQNLMMNGQSCQRLTIRFERAGLKKLITASGLVRHAGTDDRKLASERPDTAAETENDAGPTDHDPFAEADPKSVFAAIPSAARDPLASAADRLIETAKLYRFTPDGGSLLDWAATQSGLADPLARFSRQELEQFFERFAWARDQHAADLVRELARARRCRADDLLAEVPPPIARAWRRVDIGR